MAMERENRPVRGGGKRRKKVCQFCVDISPYAEKRWSVCLYRT